MSLGMASFEQRSQELDAVDVARRAARILWDRKGQVWPYLVAVAVITAAIRFVGWRYGLPLEEGGYAWRGHGDESLAQYATHGAWRLGRALADGLVLGMTLRALLGQAQPWRPDRGLLGFTAIYVAAAAVPLALFFPTIVAWQAGGFSAVPLMAAGGLGGVLGLVALAYFCLRLIVWPVGVLVEDPEMTAGRAWQAMLGARLAWLFAGILFMLPLIFGSAIATGIGFGIFGLYGIHGGFGHPPMTIGAGVGPFEAPLHAIAVGLWLSVTAAVYRLRAGLES